MELVGGGFVINGATLSSLVHMASTKPTTYVEHLRKGNNAIQDPKVKVDF